ncbi:MAG TPA: tRNA lysidine(34) synthetase TilS [Gammaproteobacteria bacterium]
MERSDQAFLARLREALEALPLEAPRFAVAYSGGVDSTVLLAALVRLDAAHPVRALHVNHGLAADADRWEASCARTAAALGVPFASARVRVAADGSGLEAAARRARYEALAGLLAPGETLLTAHQADDQLETVLLRLLRGAGVRGLRGIAPFAPFGPGYLARPLLGFSRAEIRAAAERWGLEWIEDPSNASLDHDRNYLRHAVLPALVRRWPAAGRRAALTAAQMRDAEEILADVAAADARAFPELDRLPAAALGALTAARRRNFLRHAIRALGLPVPHAHHVERLLEAVAHRRPGAHAVIRWPGAEARIYRDHVYLLRPLEPGSGPGYRGRLALDAPWQGPEGRLEAVPTAGEGIAAPWLAEGLELRFRAGGERFKPAGRAHSVSLKHWLQDEGIVPWMRDRVPLLFRGGRLVAVADLAVAAEALAASQNAPRYRIAWSDHPRIR